jgi:hypothetical protein
MGRRSGRGREARGFRKRLAIATSSPETATSPIEVFHAVDLNWT